VGRLGDCGRDEPEQEGEAGEALPEDCAALSRGAELQLHVRHHVRARTQRCLQVCSEIILSLRDLKVLTCYIGTIVSDQDRHSSAIHWFVSSLG
jgi:hypothetical protein